jgi:hypothetical protein
MPYRPDTALCPTPRAVGGRRLNWSAEAFQLTPRLHQTHLLWEPSSHRLGLLPAQPFSGNGCLFSGEASGLDAFSPYPQRRGCPASALSDNRLTIGHSVPFLSYWGPFPLRQPALPADKVRPVSRRSKPSSRSLLIGEQPHPWPLMQGQDRKSRHRGTKPRGRWGLSPATSLLSPG